MVIKKRARSESDKSNRRETILNAGFALFQKSSFEQISMADIAEKSKLAKGTLYLYFQTKEEVFLALERREYQRWILWIENHLSDKLAAGASAKPIRSLSIETFVEQFVASLKNFPELPRLFSILHTVLEYNLTDESILEFKLELKMWLERLTHLLAQRLTGFNEEDLLQLMWRAYATLVGLYQICEPPAPVKKMMQNHQELQFFKMDFYQELEQALLALFHGHHSREKAKIKSYSFFDNY